MTTPTEPTEPTEPTRPAKSAKSANSANSANSAKPLIVTLRLDDDSAAGFDRLRATHFPPERNYLAAHLTLFHHLPSTELATVVADLQDVRPHHRFPLAVTGPRLLGRGVALDLRSPVLDDLHRDLARRWKPWLTPQDRQPLRPHVTIQNKVTPATARTLYEALRHEPPRPDAEATGWSVWHYLGGPWRHELDIPFTTPTPTAD